MDPKTPATPPGDPTDINLGGASMAVRRVILALTKQGVVSLSLSEGETISIGRSSKSDLVVDDRSLSREHARLHVGDVLELEELGSTHGSEVGGRKLSAGERALVELGQPFVLGRIKCMVQEQVVTAAHTASAALPRAPASAMERAHDLVRRVAAGNISVLILGETGVGKELTAASVHRQSRRAHGPFVKVNCGAFTESLLDSELFGHERGAFTGASSRKPGLLEVASGGTLFLDEVGEMPLSLQTKLLRALEEGAVRRVGGVEDRPVDVRFVSATNRDLQAEVAAGTFRQDLYYRVAGASVFIPPLRERRDEIAGLARFFLDKFVVENEMTTALELSGDVVRWLESYRWPGNVRELRNVIERAVLLASPGPIAVDHMPPVAPADIDAGSLIDDVRRQAGDIEKRRIIAALDECAGNQTQAARRLGISRRALVNKLDLHDIPRPRKGRKRD